MAWVPSMVLSLLVTAAHQAHCQAADMGISAQACAPSGGLEFVCGQQRPEDIAHIPGSPWLIISGFSDGAGLKLVDTRNNTLERWYEGAPGQISKDQARYANCPSPPDLATFNVQGISLRKAWEGYTLYATNHGGRESIEIFQVDASAEVPHIKWRGCVLLPAGVAANSVAAFSDGTILVTELTRQGTSITDFVQGKTTGAVYALAPDRNKFERLPGTELPGNNGLETSKDDQRFFVVAFGLHAVVEYERAHTLQPLRTVTAPGFMPDNIHWDGDRLIAGGMQLDEPACGGLRKVVAGQADAMLCHRGFVIAALDPVRLQFHLLAYAEPNSAFNGVSGAVLIGHELWLSSYQADRIAHRSLPWLLP